MQQQLLEQTIEMEQTPMQNEITDEIWRAFTAARDTCLIKYWNNPPAADLGPGSEYRLAEIAALEAVAGRLRAQGMRHMAHSLRDKLNASDYLDALVTADDMDGGAAARETAAEIEKATP